VQDDEEPWDLELRCSEQTKKLKEDLNMGELEAVWV
jgi:hypothetical protein